MGGAIPARTGDHSGGAHQPRAHPQSRSAARRRSLRAAGVGFARAGTGMSEKIPVAILGATGTVGQKFVRLLAEHPWFEVAAVAASSASTGKRYGEVVRWREQIALPDRIAALIVQPSAPPLPGPIVFSALDADVAGPIEQAFAAAGAYVVTNTRTHRMDADVPLLIPEANLDHLALVDRQHEGRGWPGAILANPNCSTAALVLALAPLHRAYS